MASYNYEIGTTYENMKNVEDLYVDFPPPQGKQLEESTVVRYAVDGRAYGDGFPTALWEWDYLSQDMLNALLLYLNYQESYPVYIRTRDVLGIYAYYTAIMHRPRVDQDMIQEFGGWRQVRVRFSHLESYSPPAPPV